METKINELFEKYNIFLNENKNIFKNFNIDFIEKILKDTSITEDKFFNYFANKYNLPYIKISISLLDKNIVNILDESFIKSKMVMPVFKIQNSLTLAMINPLDLYIIDEVKKITGLSVSPVLISPIRLLNTINQFYGVKDRITILIEKLKKEIKSTDVPQRYNVEFSEIKNTPVIELVNRIIEQAVIEKASDLHLEPQINSLRIRYRIDGILHEVYNLPYNMITPIISRIKVMANLDISEKRIPQDSRIKLLLNSNEIDIRVSSSPTIFGEKLVLRIFDLSQSLNKLNNLGLSNDLLFDLKNIIQSNGGIILVTGPTGSGKSTTLYAMLQELDYITKNIVTIEDPVEYQLDKINQIQVNPKVGLTFAKGLRSILRQDPDIIMIGEIRDVETAQIAIRAALTGHLVLSTLHTNSAAGALNRLIDMGIEPYMVASTVKAVLTQRLFRKLCRDCRETFTAPKNILEKLGLADERDKIVSYTSRGCSSCKNTGYKGRVGVFEFLIVTKKIRQLILKRVPTETIHAEAVKNGMIVLKKAALKKVNEGITNLDEILNILSGEDY